MKYLREVRPLPAPAGAFRRIALSMALLSGAALAPAFAQDAAGWSAPGVTVLPGAAAQIAAASSQARVAAGSIHSCALTSAGGVKCWGRNSYGQLGDGTTTDRVRPVAVSGLASGVVAVAAGWDHSCALTSAGAAKCWGANRFGQLGDGTQNTRLAPVAVTGLTSGVTAIAGGYQHSCALTSAGAVKCWGSNAFGQLGDGTTKRLSRTPVAVSGLASGVIAIAAGRDHSCALTSASLVYCWGLNHKGQLGNGTTTNRFTPGSVILGRSSTIALGDEHSCAVTLGGASKCWGANYGGQLGDGTTIDRLWPVVVRRLARASVAAIEAGGFHSCAVTIGGAAKCWGNNSAGQLGDGTSATRRVPVDVTGLARGVVAIAAGRDHSCALTSAGAVKCWGNNGWGELGDGTTIRRLTPVDVFGF